MKLIDKDEVIKEILNEKMAEEVFVSEAEQEYLYERIQILPTVDAIPIEFIREWMRRQTGRMSGRIVIGTALQRLVEDWREENENL